MLVNTERVIVCIENEGTEAATVTGVIGSPPFKDDAAALAWLDEHYPSETASPFHSWHIQPLISQAECSTRQYGVT